MFVKMTIWPPSDEMTHARLWDFIFLSASPETICWCGSGCLSLACWHVSMETCKRCHKADLDHYTHLPADQRCSPQFHRGFGWYERASSPCQSPLEWQTVFVLFAALLLSGCLCLADVDKCLGLVCLRRRDGYVSSCDFVCQPQKAWSSWRDSHGRYASPPST